MYYTTVDIKFYINDSSFRRVMALLCRYFRLMFSIQGAIMVVIIWQLNLQLPMQSVPITTNVVCSNPNNG